MDAQFEATVYLVINQFLHRLSERSDIKSDQLWKLWKDMFNDFPKEQPVKKMLKKKETKPVVPETKSVPETKTVVEFKPVVPETKTVVEFKPVVPETKSVVEIKPVVSETRSVVEINHVVPETKSVVEIKSDVPETKSDVPETKSDVSETNPDVVESTFVPVFEHVTDKKPDVSETKVTEPEINDKKEKKPKVVTDGCQYIMTRGGQKGQECGKKKKGDQFCGLHTK
jgi:hypothetical protein